MIIDIFSTFDPFTISIFSLNKTIFFLSISLLLLLSHSWFFTKHNQIFFLFNSIFKFIYTQISSTKRINIKGLPHLFTSVFLILITLNLRGIIPYIFRYTSHLVITLNIRFIIWRAIIISTFIYDFKSSTAHLLPRGAPQWLNFFLVFIETIRTLVRPLTLAFRLAANIRAGHIVISLIGIYLSVFIFKFNLTTLSLIITHFVYFLFELGICMIQAYIFCLLLTLYSDDHA